MNYSCPPFRLRFFHFRSPELASFWKQDRVATGLDFHEGQVIFAAITAAFVFQLQSGG
ncbi:MAG: hypothetical protein K0R65_1916 [Crocinitomicaceae bacterium]|jgi:hypothetical protein|nr:hypothetical protein [Crocinitomicaceae bacterium]